MANEFPSLEDEARAASATGTTQFLERAVLFLLFAGLVIGILAVLRVHREEGRWVSGLRNR